MNGWAIRTAALIAFGALSYGSTGAFAATSRLSVSFADSAWNGKQVPDGQQCSIYGGDGATPALVVENIPKGADTILVEFNDRDYPPLSSAGGHGIVGFKIEGRGKATLPSVPGGTSRADRLPAGAFVAEDNRATGDFMSDGYLPPCSGGRGHRYFAVVKAVADGKVVATGKIELGKY